MATKTKKKYTYLTKAVQMPDGTRKYFRAKTQEELDEKVLKAQILVNAGVDICSEETFGHFAQILIAIRYARTSISFPQLAAIGFGTSCPCRFRPSWPASRTRAIPCSQRF